MRSLVTGAGGFVGANLARRLLDGGDDVDLVVHPESDRWRIDAISGRVQVHAADLGARDDVERVLQAAAPDRVFNLAAHGAYSSQTDVTRMVAANVVATGNLLELLTGTSCAAFVQAGSSSEYGFTDHAPDELEAANPNSWYAVTKAAATLACTYAGRAGLVPAVTLRLYSVYGPWEEPTRLLPTLVLAARDGRLPPLVSPEVARDFVHVDDVVNAFVVASEQARDVAGSVFNVGTGKQTTLRELVDVTRRTLGVDATPDWGSMANRSWDTDVWVADPTRIGHDLGWAARVPLDEGIRGFAEWFDEAAIRAAYVARQIPPG